MSAQKYNLRNPAVKRIVQELKEIQRDDNPDILAEVLEDNMFEWHFVIRGAWGTEFEKGIYHGRILMPADYPFKPPAFVMLTPSGRFETGTKICLSISSYHPESWQPSWSVRSALVALIAFMQTPGSGAVGSLDHSPEVRRGMAAEARATPPKHGSSDRQALINEMHQRMLELEDRSRALSMQEAPAETQPSQSGSAAEAAAGSAPAQGETQDVAVVEQDAAVRPAAEAPAHADERRANDQEADGSGTAQLADLASPALPWGRPPARPAASPESASAATPAAGPQSPVATAPPPTTASPSPQLGPPLHQLEREEEGRPLPPAAASVPLHPVAAVPAGSGTWEDRGLTYFAVLLAVSIAALLLRRVFVSLGLQPVDDVFSANPVPDVEL